jgi:hypothetical protein
MSNKKTSTPIKVLNIALSFILSVLLFSLSLLVVVKIAIFNEHSMIKAINNSEYISEKNKEITTSLVDLGYASGLDEYFFEGLLTDSLLEKDISEYISNFYSGQKSVVDTNNFKEILNNSLDEYIQKKQIDPSTVSDSSREYLVDTAAKTYKKSLELPFFQKIAGYFLGVKNALPVVMIINSLMIILIGIIILNSSKIKWGHLKYICYSTTTTFLCLLVPTISLLAFDKTKQLNIESQATSNLFIAIVNEFTLALVGVTVFFAIISFILYMIQRKTTST